ncbi:MAG: TIGR04197 family type VII secretion effector [Lachnospiraceae bacterium]|nr:TIGR04197 family type VII secretion effector [Lachnospiraceae bacterium]
MGNKINISESDVARHSSEIENSAVSMEVKALSPMDEESTIVGNDLCKSAYEASQQALAKLIEALRTEASKIEGLGDDFRQMDEELALLVKLVSE